MSKELTVTIKLTPENIEKVRSSHYLAKDLTDEEIVEHMEELSEELNDFDQLNLILDQLDYFN